MVASGGLALLGPSVARDALLRRALAADALLCAAGGVVMIVGSGWLSDFTGLTPGWLPAALGGALLLWALEVAIIARADVLAPARVRLVIGGNLAWVIASYGILLTGRPELTSAGALLVGILAEVVALFAVVQYFGLRRLRA